MSCWGSWPWAGSSAFAAGCYDAAWYLQLCQWAAPLGFVAVLAGWTVTEVGRQPWTIYGLMRTSQSVSPSLTGRDVLWSLLAYAVVYLLMFPAGIAVMARLVRAGPSERPATDRPPEVLQSGSSFNVPAE